MNQIERYHSEIGGSTRLEHLYTFEQFPVFMGCLAQPVSADLKLDMSWWICRDSGLIQLKKLVPLDVLYPESHGAGAIGELWNRHHKAFSSFLRKVTPASVLEIGGAHGILAKEYQNFSNIPWTILEPNPTPVVGCHARFIKGFFDGNFKGPDVFNVVVHSHVFEHIYQPDEFMGNLSAYMADGQHLVFSIPNMQIMLERKYTNCINFEHTILLTEPYVEFLLASHGFRLIAKEYFMDDHSIFYAAIRDASVPAMKLPVDLYEKNKKLYLDYVSYHENLIHDLNQKLAELKNPVYLFGAHVFAQYLIAFGLHTNRIVSLLDNDPKKQGRRLYGTQLLVQSPKILREIQAPVVVLKAGVYNEEIRNDILANINPGCIFLE